MGTRVRSGAGDVCWTSCVGGWIGSDAGGVVAGRGNRVWRRSVCADRAWWCVSCDPCPSVSNVNKASGSDEGTGYGPKRER